MTFLIPLLLRGMAVLAVMGFLYSLWYKVDHWCNSECRQFRESADVLRQEKQAAQDRATALALLWAKQVEVTDEKVRAARAERGKAFADLVAGARRLRPTADLRLSPAGQRLLADSSRLANNAAAPAGGDQAPADPVPDAPSGDRFYSEAELAEFVAKSAEAYADAYAQWASCVNHYEHLRAAQAPELR